MTARHRPTWLPKFRNRVSKEARTDHMPNDVTVAPWAKSTRDPWSKQALLVPVNLPDHILPTHATADRHPIHRWFGFVAGYAPEYVRACAQHAGLDSNDVILDPFAGCGTTLVEANILGISSIGFEPHPFLADMCRAKLLCDVDPATPFQLYEILSKGRRAAPSKLLSESARQFLEKLVKAESLELLLGARLEGEKLPQPQSTLARLILSRTLDLCSHSKTDGIYKAPTSGKASLSFENALSKVCTEIAEDLARSSQRRLKNKAQVIECSSEDMGAVAPSTASLMITSPPYLNNFDFAEMTRMQLYFWEYAKDWGDITQRVRSKLIVNTTTALRGHKTKVAEYRAEVASAVHARLDSYQHDLAKQRGVKPGKKEYDYLIYPYFAQMTRVLKSAIRVLKPGADARIIVSDAALYGVHVETHAVLSAIMEKLGYKNVSWKRLRQRGTRWVLAKRQGADGLGEYELKAQAPSPP